jgi:hypothetical protein
MARENGQLCIIRSDTARGKCLPFKNLGGTLVGQEKCKTKEVVERL